MRKPVRVKRFREGGLKAGSIFVCSMCCCAVMFSQWKGFYFQCGTIFAYISLWGEVDLVWNTLPPLHPAFNIDFLRNDTLEWEILSSENNDLRVFYGVTSSKLCMHEIQMSGNLWIGNKHSNGVLGIVFLFEIHKKTGYSHKTELQAEISRAICG